MVYSYNLNKNVNYMNKTFHVLIAIVYRNNTHVI